MRITDKDKERNGALKKTAVFTLLLCIISLPCIGEETSSLKEKKNDAHQVMSVSGHPNYPPFMWEKDGTIVGAGVDLLRLICEELNIPYEIKWTGPWKRVQSLAKYGALDFIVGIYSNEDRRTYLDYSIPYKDDQTSITVLKGKSFEFKGREDLIGRIGVTMHGDSFGEELDNYIKAKLNVQRAYTVDAIFKNLVSGRVDYVLWGYYPTVINAVEEGVREKIYIYNNPLVTENMYMAVSKQSPYRKYLKRINSVIKRCKKDGTVAKMLENNLKVYNSKIAKKTALKER